MKLVPVAKLVPPVEFAYQLIVPALAAAVKLTVPAPQRLAGVVEVIVGMVFTTTATAVEVSLQLLPLVTITR